MASMIDPVCGKHLEPHVVIARVEHDGTTYGFCSDACRDRFTAAPADYLGDEGPTTCANRGGAISQDDLECPHCGISLVVG